MMEDDPKSSVHNEQFGEPENTEKKASKNPKVSGKVAGAKITIPKKAPTKKKQVIVIDNSAEKDSVKNIEVTGSEISNPDKDEKIELPDTDSGMDLHPDEVELTATGVNEAVVPDAHIVEDFDATLEAANEKDAFITDPSENQEHSGFETLHKHSGEFTDYSKLSKEELVKALKNIVEHGSYYEIRKDVDLIKSFFYKKHKSDIEVIKNKFLEDGGLIQDFKIEESPVEVEIKAILDHFKSNRNEHNKKVDDDKTTNLDKKYKIIEKIKELVNSQESLNKTFHEFRDLQNDWREIGPVPQQNLKDLWESYHYQVEAFYDYIKINKELRDLDLKKNMEAKMKLCENAEELLLEPSVVEAFRKLQKLHDQWREIGPVPVEKRSEIWERFKESTAKINHKHQEYFVGLKHDQKKNYEEKLVLCDKAEEIAGLEIENHKDWEDKSRDIIELQKIWKTIGFAPKKYNAQVYERFRKACDKFFEQKRAHYSLNRDEQLNNLQLKAELCLQAELLQDSNDWKKTTDELIRLQKKWKEIGPVPTKNSEKIWKRFRSSCDKFFENKSKFYSTIDVRYEENLQMKLALIAEIEKFELSQDVEKNLNALKEFQRKWTEIGFVPIKEKNEIQEHFRKVINEKFDQLRLDDDKKVILKFRNRVENIMNKPNSQQRMRIERDKCFNKLKQLENDITLWENNIGFFSQSKNAASMIEDVNNKIESTKIKIAQLKDRIRVLDDLED